MHQKLKMLNGHWIGSGEGMYPTLDSFYYRDEITFNVSENEPVIHFEQKTWIADERNIKHWETGFFSIIGNDQLKIYSCHNNGRVEILKGKIDHPNENNGLLSISFKSESVYNEENLKVMSGSERLYTIGKSILEYKVLMTTNEVKDMKIHLISKLRRS